MVKIKRKESEGWFLKEKDYHFFLYSSTYIFFCFFKEFIWSKMIEIVRILIENTIFNEKVFLCIQFLI